MTAGISRTADVFAIGLQALRNKDFDQAREAFTRATKADPSMCDAWLGRMRAGDGSLDVVAGAYKSRGNFGQLLKQNQMRVEQLEVSIALTLGTAGFRLPINREAELAMAYAVALAEAQPPQLAAASAILDAQKRRPGALAFDQDLADYAYIGLLGLARRWPDVLSAVSKVNWRIGQDKQYEGVVKVFDAAVLLWKVWALIGTGAPADAQRWAEACLEQSGLPEDLNGRLRLARGYALRAQGKREEAMQAFTELKAWLDTPEVREAIDNPDKTVEFVTAESLATRADVWDPTSGQSASELQIEERDSKRASVRAEAMAELESQIGLGGVKSQIKRLEARNAMDALRAERGLGSKRDVALSYVFVGGPGTGKTTLARIVAKLLFGLGLIARPDVVEAKRADLVGEYLGQSAPKTNAVIDKALGGLLFIDEAYALYAKGYSDGDAYGEEVITTLLARMENERTATDPNKKLAVVIAGYEDDIDWFLSRNDGLPGRFNTRIRFDQYSTDELLAIADKMASAEDSLYSAEAQEWLRRNLDRLADMVIEDTNARGVARRISGINKAGNARFIRAVTEKATEVRDYRISSLEQGSLTSEDLVTLSVSDVTEAYREACATQRIPFP